MKEKNKNAGKSKCCQAEIIFSGGGYDGEDIVPVVSQCKDCGLINPRSFGKVGRPVKVPF